ncbi:hypothetical protein FHT97_004113 [Rhizobium sp. BK399]|nr:hypothetical protein [Rhizobium sp. BK399]
MDPGSSHRPLMIYVVATLVIGVVITVGSLVVVGLS